MGLSVRGVSLKFQAFWFVFFGKVWQLVMRHPNSCVHARVRVIIINNWCSVGGTSLTYYKGRVILTFVDTSLRERLVNYASDR